MPHLLATLTFPVLGRSFMIVAASFGKWLLAIAMLASLFDRLRREKVREVTAEVVPRADRLIVEASAAEAEPEPEARAEPAAVARPVPRARPARVVRPVTAPPDEAEEAEAEMHDVDEERWVEQDSPAEIARPLAATREPGPIAEPGVEPVEPAPAEPASTQVDEESPLLQAGTPEVWAAAAAPETPTQDLCEIGFWRGYMKGGFYARTFDADGEAVAVAESKLFRAQGNGIPERTDKAAAAFEALVAHLKREGWKPVDEDADPWYAQTFRRSHTGGAEPAPE